MCDTLCHKFTSRGHVLLTMSPLSLALALISQITDRHSDSLPKSATMYQLHDWCLNTTACVLCGRCFMGQTWVSSTQIFVTCSLRWPHIEHMQNSAAICSSSCRAGRHGLAARPAGMGRQAWAKVYTQISMLCVSSVHAWMALTCSECKSLCIN